MAEEAVLDEKGLNEAMDESIRSTLHDIQAREVPEPPEAAAPVTEAEPVKARDEAGKFTKAPAKESAAPAETPSKSSQEATEPAAADTAIGVESAPAFDIARPPSSWKPAAKAAWAALPEPVRAEIYRREGDFHNGNKGIRENADFGQSVRGIVEPYRGLILAEGGTPEKAIADTMRTAALFRVGTPQQKLQALFDIDRQFNAGLNAHFQAAVADAVAKQTGQAPAVQTQTFQDPRVDQILGSIQSQERERHAQGERVANSAVENFIAAKDDKGQPRYPFVENVLEDMSARIAALRAANPALEHAEALKQAYEAAVWANPETRQVLLSQQQATAAQPSEIQRRVDAAKRANAVNVPKRGAIPASGSVGVLKIGTPESDESIRDTYRQLTGTH